MIFSRTRVVMRSIVNIEIFIIAVLMVDFNYDFVGGGLGIGCFFSPHCDSDMQF